MPLPDSYEGLMDDSRDTSVFWFSRRHSENTDFGFPLVRLEEVDSHGWFDFSLLCWLWQLYLPAQNPRLESSGQFQLQNFQKVWKGPAWQKGIYNGQRKGTLSQKGNKISLSIWKDGGWEENVIQKWKGLEHFRESRPLIIRPRILKLWVYFLICFEIVQEN